MWRYRRYALVLKLLSTNDSEENPVPLHAFANTVSSAKNIYSQCPSIPTFYGLVVKKMEFRVRECLATEELSKC